MPTNSNIVRLPLQPRLFRPHGAQLRHSSPLHYIIIPQNLLILETYYSIHTILLSNYVHEGVCRYVLTHPYGRTYEYYVPYVHCKGRRSQLEGTNEMSNALARRRRLVGNKPVPTVAS